jgi:putative nucleotidyltransferase with HDIG domain
VTIQKVMALANDPDSSFTELSSVIRLDQAITANILRLCNSAYFGLCRPVDNVNEAIMHMGRKNVLRAVMAAGLSRYFRTAKGYDVKGGELWEHAVAVALLSQICAARISRPDDPQLFTAGVLHDIGKMVMGEFVHEAWQKIQDLMERERYSFLEAEEEVLGINHAELGGEIALIWKFPDEILKAIAVMGIGVGTVALAYRAVGDVAGRFQLKQRDLEDMMAQLHQSLQGARELVSIVSKPGHNGRG